MNEFRLPDLLADECGLDLMEFRSGDLTRHIPNDRILEELFYPPSPEIIKSLPALFGISDTDILNKVNKLHSPSWEDICETIHPHVYEGCHNPKWLYHFASLNAYKEKHHCHHDTSTESVSILYEFSNKVVSNIFVFLQQHIAEFEKIHQILQKNELSASEYIYSFVLVHYCRSILPLPQRLTLNRKSAKQAIDLLYKLPIETATPTEYLAESKYWESSFESGYNLQARFSTFAESLSYTKQLCENDEFNQALERLNYSLATEDRRNHEKQLDESKKSKKLGNYILSPPIEYLHQCEFCYRFYLEKSSKQSLARRHCGNKTCKQHYKNWDGSLPIPLRSSKKEI